MSCGSLRARLLTAALIGASVMPISRSPVASAAPGRPCRAAPRRSRRADASRPAAAGQAPPAGPPAGQPGAPQQPAFRTGINFVRVDALVTDNKGNAVPT